MYFTKHLPFCHQDLIPYVDHMKVLADILKVVMLAKKCQFISYFAERGQGVILKVCLPEHDVTFSSLKHTKTNHRTPTLILSS